ncbi:prostate stem cell antigen [Gymnodraco acuticeps]|uniref:Prostate stem cell antigen n=1 Tax=Gymnodraco acuticeps TaxID=8218 RepID=A0A6P8TPV7_GYMAC|nr:prostate stem cell antigen [Gymnodraco acuticeps]
MNRIILQLLAVGFCFAVGQALQCYKCTLGFGDVCITTKTTCKNGEHCFSGNGEAVGFVDIKKKGCLVLAKCNLTENTNLPDSISSSNTTVYKMTKTCCSTDLCNAAPGLPGASGVSLALATVTALFMANILV